MTENNRNSSASKPYQFSIGIRGKILLALTFFNLCVTIIFTVNQHQTEKSRILDGIESKLNATATALPRMLPDGYLDLAVTPDAISQELYRSIVDQLNDYCAKNNLIYLYTYLYDESGRFFCTSSNGTPEEMALGEFTPYFDLYAEAPDSIFQAVETMKPVKEVVTDRWGTVFTLFYPFKTEGGNIIVAGADLDIAFVDQLLGSSLKRSLALGSGAFVLIFGLSFFASNHYSRAIKRLDSYTQEFTSTEFSVPAESVLRDQILKLPNQHRDEIGRLVQSFLTMENQLFYYLKNLKETTAAKERIENELVLASQIQLGMLPKSLPSSVGSSPVELHASMVPARQIGGDLYDYFYLDDEHLCFYIGDVSGKGIPAALFMSVAVTVLRANSSLDNLMHPEVILSKANNLLCWNNENCTFLTLFFGLLNVRTGILTFVDAGHNRPFYRPHGQRPTFLDVHPGTALGVLEDLPFKPRTCQMAPGDTLFLYTDGVTEAISSDDTFYGDDRLENLLTDIPEDAPVSEWISTVMKDIAIFANGAEPSDDITLLTLRRPIQ